MGDVQDITYAGHISATIGSMIAVHIKHFGEELVLDNGEKVPPTLDLFESRVVSILSDVKAYMQDTKRNRLDYDTEAMFHHTLSDCRSELAMIQHILAQQDNILRALLDDLELDQMVIVSEHEDRGKNAAHSVLQIKEARDAIQGALDVVQGYQERVTKIDGDAERIEKNVQDLLNLKRTYASVQDSHASVLLSAAAIGFAIVTIVFAPLAFLTALFALDMQGFDKLRIKEINQNDSGTNRDDSDANVSSDKQSPFDSSKIAGIFGE